MYLSLLLCFWVCNYLNSSFLWRLTFLSKVETFLEPEIYVKWVNSKKHFVYICFLTFLKCPKQHPQKVLIIAFMFMHSYLRCFTKKLSRPSLYTLRFYNGSHWHGQTLDIVRDHDIKSLFIDNEEEMVESKIWDNLIENCEQKFVPLS